MSDALDIIDQLPGEFLALLEADEYFADIPIIIAEEGDVESMMRVKQAAVTAKAGKRGAAVIILQMAADDAQPNLRFGPMTLYPTFQTVENLQLNRDASGTGKSSRKIARRIRDVVKACGFEGMITDLRPLKPCIEPVNLTKELGALVKSHAIYFECLEKAETIARQVARPMFDLSVAGQVGISCATAGAVICYSLDGSPPSPLRLQAGSGIYMGPIVVPAGGCTIRACARAAGMVASTVVRMAIAG